LSCADPSMVPPVNWVGFGALAQAASATTTHAPGIHRSSRVEPDSPMNFTLRCS
jgi:hypothetical protein